MLPLLAGGAILGGVLGSKKQKAPQAPGAAAAGRLMNQIGNTPMQFVDQSGITMDALSGVESMGMDISPALDYTTRVLSGDFMGGNPYLDTMFDRAAGRIRNTMDTQFAKAGRYGSDAHQTVMTDQYNNLAADMYGGAYDAERARMGQAAAMLPGMFGQGISNFQGLLGLGDAERRVRDEKTNWSVYEPNRRLQLMQPGMGFVQAPPTQNRGAGALGGALSGLQLVSGLLG